MKGRIIIGFRDLIGVDKGDGMIRERRGIIGDMKGMIGERIGIKGERIGIKGGERGLIAEIVGLDGMEG